jgi:N-hydroxyarylamine O-acetyltransferase
MRLLRDGTERDLYVFTLAPAEEIDFEVAHHFTSTHPSSVFARSLTVQRCGSTARRVLRDRCYTERRDGEETTREISDRELGPLLARAFGLQLPGGLLEGVLERLNASPPESTGGSTREPGT